MEHTGGVKKGGENSGWKIWGKLWGQLCEEKARKMGVKRGEKSFLGKEGISLGGERENL